MAKKSNNQTSERMGKLELDATPVESVADLNTDVFKSADTSFSVGDRKAFKDANGTWHNAIGLESTAEHRHVSKIWQDQCISLLTFAAGLQQDAAKKRDITMKETDFALSEFLTLPDGSGFTRFGIETLRRFAPEMPSGMVDYLFEHGFNADLAKYLNLELAKRFAAAKNEKQQNREFLIRKRETATGEVNRAVLSERYGIIDNAEAIEWLLAALPDNGAENALASHLNDDGDNIVGNILLPDYIKSFPDSDYGVGIAFTNSEVGRFRFALMPFAFRAICLNGTIWDRAESEIRLNIKHIGTHERAELAERVKVVVQNTLNLGNAFVDQMQLTKQVIVNDHLRLIASEARQAGLTIKQGQAWDKAYYIEIAEKSPENTGFALVNGLTRAAQEFHGDDRVTMESIAGSLITPDLHANKETVQKHWEKKVNAAYVLTEKEVAKYQYITLA